MGIDPTKLTKSRRPSRPKDALQAAFRETDEEYSDVGAKDDGANLEGLEDINEYHPEEAKINKVHLYEEFDPPSRYKPKSKPKPTANETTSETRGQL